jgi:thermitase
MLKRILTVLSLSALSFSQAHASSLHTGEILFKIKPASLNQKILSQFQIPSNINPQAIEVIRPKNVRDLEAYRRTMIESNAFEFVVFNTIETEPEVIPEELDLSNQWHHEKIQSSKAWQYTAGSNDVVVAVCDSGIQRDHEDLQGRVIEGWNLVENNDDPSTSTSHGTFVGGIIGATLDDKGVSGVSPRVKLMPIRISDNRGSTTMKRITDCITLAADKGAKVINVSFTGVNSAAVEAAGKYAREKGSLLVYSAGNHGKFRSQKDYPKFENVLAVGATSYEDNRWTWRKFLRSGGSNYGPFIDIMAPGHNLTSTTVYNLNQSNAVKYRTGSGTSYSAPVVSGVAALIYSVNPQLTPKDVENILFESADPLQMSNYGAGRVNALEAVRLASQRAR